MELQHKSDSLKKLGAICNNHSSLSTRIALLSLEKKNPSVFIEAFILFIEYIQILSQIFLFDLGLYASSTQSASPFFQGIVYIAEMITPGYWLPYKGYGSLTIVVLFIIAGFTVMKYILFGYIAVLALKQSQGNSLLKFIWKWIFKLQSRVIFSLFAVFWVNSITTLISTEDEIESYGIGRGGVLILSSFMIVIDYTFSLFLDLRFCYILPTKHFLASKDNQLKIFNLTHKLAIQILRIVLPERSSTSIWVFTTINLALSLIKDFKYFTTLPYYKIPALYLQGILLALVTSLNVSCFFQIIAKASGYEGDIVSFIFVVWVIFSIMLTKIYHGYLTQTIIDIITDKQRLSSPEIMIHKASIINHIRSQRQIPSEANKKIGIFHLVNTNINQNIDKVLNIDSSFAEEGVFDIDSKESKNKLLLHYLETLSNKYPKNKFIKLFLAYFYAKKMKLYGNAIKLIAELKKDSFSNVIINSSILVFEIQGTMKTEYQRNDEQLDLFTYTMSHSLFAKLQGKIITQVQRQIEICQEIIKDCPDLGKIFDWSQSLDSLRNNIKKRMDGLFETLPDAYIEPLLIAAEYQFRLNHSVSEYQSYKKVYVKKYEKYEKFFENSKLIKDNLYQKSNAFVMFSGQRADAGKIVYCNKSVEKIFGGESNLYIGTQISSVMPPSLQSYYTNLFRSISEKENGDLLNKLNRIYIYHKEGYLKEAYIYLNIHPYLTQGFYFNMIIRPINTKTDYLLLRENGDIECATKRIGHRLGLINYNNSSPNINLNIKLLNEDLDDVNQSFNIMGLPEKHTSFIRSEGKRRTHLKTLCSPTLITAQTYQAKGDNEAEDNITNDLELQKNETMTKASMLYASYSAGKEIVLKSVQKSIEDERYLNKSYYYTCKIENKFYGSVLLKLITLEESHFQAEDESGTSETKGKVEDEKDLFEGVVPNENNGDAYEDKTCDITKPEDSCVMGIGDEKQSGWIELHNLLSPTSPKYLSIPSPLILSPTLKRLKTGLSEIYPAIESPLNASNSHFLFNNKFPSSSQITSPLNSPLGHQITGPLASPRGVVSKVRTIKKETMTKSTKSEQEEGIKFTKIDRRYIPEGSVATSQKSKTSQMRKVSSALKTALSTKYYPKFFYIACFGLYASLVIVFATQANLKTTLDRTIESLTVKKDILSGAQNRNYNILYIHSLIRMIWNLHVGFLSVSDLGFIGAYFSVFVDITKTALSDLAKINGVVFKSIDALEASDKDFLFQTNVRVFDTYFDEPVQRSINLTNFQATNALIETGFKIMEAEATNLSEASHEVKFLFRNSLNDLLLVNEQTSSDFFRSLDNQRKDIQRIVDTYMIIGIILLAIVTASFIVIIWKQYFREKTNMYSFSRLNNRGVQKVLDSFIRFKEALEKEKGFKENDNEGLNSSHKALAKNSAKGMSRKDNMKIPKHIGLRKKYIVYTGSLIIFMIVIMSLIIMNSLIDKNSMKFFEEKQSQVYFIDRLKARAYADRSAVLEMLGTNDIAMVENVIASEAMVNQIADLASMRLRATTLFINQDSSIDPRIQTLLFSDGCTLLGEAGMMFCMILAQAGVKSNLINLLYIMEETLSLTLDTYKRSDKSPSVLKNLRAHNFLLQTSACTTIVSQCDYISSVLNDSFEESLNSAENQRNSILIVFTIALAVLCILIWFYVLKKLREADNNFKKVLKTFPANLVLSSFILKTFLIKTSKGALDFVKNEI